MGKITRNKRRSTTPPSSSTTTPPVASAATAAGAAIVTNNKKSNKKSRKDPPQNQLMTTAPPPPSRNAQQQQHVATIQEPTADVSVAAAAAARPPSPPPALVLAALQQQQEQQRRNNNSNSSSSSSVEEVAAPEPVLSNSSSHSSSSASTANGNNNATTTNHRNNNNHIPDRLYQPQLSELSKLHSYFLVDMFSANANVVHKALTNLGSMCMLENHTNNSGNNALTPPPHRIVILEQLGGPACILGCLHKFYYNAKIQSQGLLTMSTIGDKIFNITRTATGIATPNNNNDRQRAGRATAASAEVDTATAATTTTTTSTTTTQVRWWQASLDGGVLNIIRCALLNYPQDLLVQQVACMALSTLVKYRSMNSLIVAAAAAAAGTTPNNSNNNNGTITMQELFGLVVRAQKAFADCVELQKSACAFWDRIIVSPSTTTTNIHDRAAAAAIRKWVTQAGGLVVLAKAIEGFQDDTVDHQAIQNHASAAMKRFLE